MNSNSINIESELSNISGSIINLNLSSDYFYFSSSMIVSF